MSISMLLFFSHQEQQLVFSQVGFMALLLDMVQESWRNHNITTSFSQRITDAWKEATESDKAVIAGEGTGHHI